MSKSSLVVASLTKLEWQNVYAVDQVADRLEEAKRHGADKTFHLTDEDVPAKVKELTDGRGADVVLEVVGVEPALHLAIDMIRNFGVISSCGIHNKPVTLKGLDLYSTCVSATDDTAHVLSFQTKISDSSVFNRYFVDCRD